jgi:hypothetical protein
LAVASKWFTEPISELVTHLKLPHQWVVRALAPFGLLFFVACGDADIGEECDETGDTDECVDGAVCTNDGEGAVCRALCVEQEDCPDDEACNGISGTSLKSCQPDK